MQLSPSGKSYSLKLNMRFAILSALLCCSLFSLQCKKEITTTSSSAKLTFSGNLIFFDTVFVTRGSSVRIFVVHNNNNQAVVTNIKLQGSYTSPFEINVDGGPGTVFNNIKIPAKDSIYVFTQVNINPLDSNNPMVIQDSLVFTTNGNIQSVHLLAYGWNAYYYYPNITPKNGPAYGLVKCGDVWKSDKPHVIFGYLLDTAGCTLTIEAGTHVYFHDSATLYIDGSLKVLGTAAQQVTFQGDRLEPDYKYLPGQWGEIFLAPGSTNSKISWAVIQNGTTGIQADTVGNIPPTLAMDHTIIKGMSSYGLLAEGATIVANNCLIADCQYGCLLMEYGGTYTFNQCTFADYWGVDNSYGQRTTALLNMNNYYVSGMQTIYRPINKAFFGNCIIYGALNEEITFDSASSNNDLMNYYFENCVIKTQHIFPNNHFDTVIGNDPSFYNPSADNYQVNNGSPAIGNGNNAIGAKYDTDLNGTITNTPPYTIGAYQK